MLTLPGLDVSQGLGGRTQALPWGISGEMALVPQQIKERSRAGQTACQGRAGLPLGPPCLQRGWGSAGRGRGGGEWVRRPRARRC